MNIKFEELRTSFWTELRHDTVRVVWGKNSISEFPYVLERFENGAWKTFNRYADPEDALRCATSLYLYNR